jgi:hypothetical protein
MKNHISFLGLFPSTEMNDEFESLVRCRCSAGGWRGAGHRRSKACRRITRLRGVDRKSLWCLPHQSGRRRPPQCFWRCIRSKRPQAAGEEINRYLPALNYSTIRFRTSFGFAEGVAEPRQIRGARGLRRQQPAISGTKLRKPDRASAGTGQNAAMGQRDSRSGFGSEAARACFGYWTAAYGCDAAIGGRQASVRFVGVEARNHFDGFMKA